jgi:hypothetical protein
VSLSGPRFRAKDATTATVQRGNPRITVPGWAGLLWGLALLGLLLLPSDYRAGAETPHAHALLQLWLDAGDGSVHHHHGTGVHAGAWDWLELPALDVEAAGSDHTSPSGPDVGEHQDSVPAGGGAHLLLQTVPILFLAAPRIVPQTGPGRPLRGRAVAVLLPPPRWTSLTG